MDGTERAFRTFIVCRGGQQLLYHQERQRGLAVAERAVHHLLYRVGKRHPQCADELILIRMRLSSVQPRRQVEVDALVAEAGGRLQHGQLAPVVGGQPGFLAQLTLGADERVFIHPIELARRNFQRQAANGDAMLADENHVPVIIQRDNARRARMARHLAQGGFAVGQAHMPMLNADNLAGENDFPIQILFRQLLVVHHGQCPPQTIG